MVDVVAPFLGTENASRKSEIAEAVMRHTAAWISDGVASLERSCADAYPDQSEDGNPLWKRAVAAWNSEEWAAPTPSNADLGVARQVRVGTVELRSADGRHRLEVPALIPFIGNSRGNLIIAEEGPALDAATAALESVALRLVATFRPGKLRLVGIDSVGLGQAFATCSGLVEAVRDARFWHEPREIAAALSKLTDHVSMVIQKYLRNEHSDLEAFNRKAEQVAEPYRVLLVARFPAGFTNETANQLLSLAKNGPRTGVHVLVSWDLKAPLPYGFGEGAVAELYRSASVIRDGSWLNSPLGAIPIQLDGTPAPTLVKALIDNVNPLVAQADRVEVPFDKFRPPKIWDGRSTDGIETPIGWHGAREPLSWRFGFEGTSHHALVCGRTGSGKTVLLHAFVCGLALRYAPQELEFYLLDFKEGVAFEPYARLPHTKVIAIEAEREFGLSVLRALAQEIEDRGRLFREAHVEDLPSWRKATGKSMPRIVLVIDEFQTLIDRSDRLANEARQLLDNPLTRKGRAFGVHVVLASQTLSTVDLEPSTLSQIGIRIALQMSEADSVKVMGKDNDEAKYLERPGEALYNSAGGLPGRNAKFQVTLVRTEEVRALAAELAASALAARFVHEPIVFEGHRPVGFCTNRELVGLIDAPRPETVPRWYDLFLGSPATVQRSHVRYRLRRQSRGNLLLIGQDNAAAAATVISAVVSFGLQVPVGQACLRLLNLVNVDDPLFDVFELVHCLPLAANIGDRSDLERSIAEMTAELRERQQAAGDSKSRLATPPQLMVCFGLQSARALQKVSSRPSAAAAGLKQLLIDGPSMGLHVLCWVDTWTNLTRVFEPTDTSEFGGRIAFRGGDSQKVLGAHSITTSLPRHNYGLLVDDEDAEQLIKFRCYDLASAPALRTKLESSSFSRGEP